MLEHVLNLILRPAARDGSYQAAILVFYICPGVAVLLSKTPAILPRERIAIYSSFTQSSEEKYTQIYEILEKVMIEKKNIHPNVDFPCGPTYYMMGIDIDFYTPIFVMSRITGWSAHIMEQHASNKLIRPLSKYKGEEVREVMLLNQR